MIRLFFPRIDFSGRVSRGVFWRELAVAALTAPIVLGLLTYLIHEFRVAATDGLAVDDARAKALAGFALTAIGLRNTVAFWSIVKRRMNDIGYGRVDLWRDSRPLYYALVLLVIGTIGLPFGGVTAILYLPVFYILLWQAKKVVSFAWRLIIAPSVDSLEAEEAARLAAAPLPPNRLDLQLAQWLGQKTRQTNMQEFLRATKNEFERLSQDAGNSKIWADLKKASHDSGALAGISKWLDQPVVTTPHEGSRSERREREVKLIPKRHKTTFKSPPTRAVTLARSEPKHGRSSLISGLLRGPWG